MCKLSPQQTNQSGLEITLFNFQSVLHNLQCFFSHQGKKAPEEKILFKWNGVNGYSLHIFLGFTLYKNESEDKQEEIFLLQKIPYK